MRRTPHLQFTSADFRQVLWRELESNYVTEQINVEKVTVVLLYMFQ